MEVQVGPPKISGDVSSEAAAGRLVEALDESRRERNVTHWLETCQRCLSAKVASDILRLIDFCSMFSAGWFAFHLYSLDRYGDWNRYGLVSLLGSFLLVNALQSKRAYDPERIREPLSHVQGLASALLFVAAGLVAVAFLTKSSESVSRGWSLIWLVLTFVLLVGTRGGFSFLLSRPRSATRRWLRRNVAIVGAGLDAERLIDYTDSAGDGLTRIVGLFDDDCHEVPAAVRGYDVRGTVADLCEFCRTTQIDTIYIALPWSDENAVFKAIRQLDSVPVDIRLVPGPLGYSLLNRRVSHLYNLPVLHVADRPLGDWGKLLKWLEDRVISTLALLLLAPLMALIAIAIKLDSPGPVLFRQDRYGFNNHVIEVLKFRTMRDDLSDKDGSRLTSRDDPRITRVGRFLRRSSIDEVPQLINVVRGEMSIVGPRPHPIGAKAVDRLYQDIVTGYAARHKVKPGITGWAQVNGWRGNTETEEQLRKRIEFDLFYLNNWSILFDIKIISMTPFAVLLGRNAY